MTALDGSEGRLGGTPAINDDGGTNRMAFCQVEVVGHLPGDWSEWFDGMAMTDLPDGHTLLAGLVCDQAALHGLIDKVFALGLSLVSVNHCVAKVQSHGRESNSLALEEEDRKEDGATWRAR